MITPESSYTVPSNTKTGIAPGTVLTGGNDIALAYLLDSVDGVDGLWIYSDQAHHYINACNDPTK